MSQSTAQATPEVHTNGSSQASPTPAVGIDASTGEIERIFNLQQAHQFTVAKTNARERKEKLKRLHKAVLARKQDLRDAMYADFRKHASEVDLTEIYPVTGEIKHAVRHLSTWMRPQRVKTPLSLLGSSSHIHYEPKGVVLIIAPWNFPVNLTFGPLVAAVAAGNCVMIKPSEHTPHTSAAMKSIIDDIFDEIVKTYVDAGQTADDALLNCRLARILSKLDVKIVDSGEWTHELWTPNSFKARNRRPARGSTRRGRQARRPVRPISEPKK